VHQVTTNGKVLRSTISSDGKYIAYIFEEAGRRGISLQEVNAATAVPVVPTDNSYGLDDLQFNATSDHLFIGSCRLIYRIPILGGTPEHFFSADSFVHAYRFSVSPEEKRVAYFDFDTTRGFPVLRIDSVKSADRRSPITAVKGRFRGRALSWRQDGKELACVAEGDSGKSLLLLNPEDLSQRIVPSPMWKDISDLVWHSNAQDLLVAGTVEDGTGSLWLCSSRSGEVRELSTDPSVGWSLSVTRGGNAISMVKSVSRTSLWVVPDGDVARAQKLSTNAAGAESGVAWYTKDILVFPVTEGGQPRLGFFNVLNGMTEYKSLQRGDEIDGILVPAVSRSRQIFVPVSRKRSGFALLRYDKSTEAVECVAEGYIARSSISNDERTIVFDALVKGKIHVMKMTLPGGSPQQLVDDFSGCPTFSPDGKKIAFYALVPYEREKGMVKYVLGTLDIRTGERVIVTDGVYGYRQHSLISWTNDGKGIIYCGVDRGVSVLWVQDLKGSPAHSFLRFPYGEVYGFALAPDGKTIALAAGSTYSDVVVLTAR
jgi:Tol biopolymer transport system component